LTSEKSLIKNESFHILIKKIYFLNFNKLFYDFLITIIFYELILLEILL